MIRAAIRLLAWFPRELDRLHLSWARDHLQKWDPCHPDLPLIVRRINELERR